MLVPTHRRIIYTKIHACSIVCVHHMYVVTSHHTELRSSPLLCLRVRLSVRVSFYVLQCVAVCCSVLQCVAVHCSVLQCPSVCACVCLSVCQSVYQSLPVLQHTATHCNTLQHTATHRTTLQHAATHCNTHGFHLIESPFLLRQTLHAPALLFTWHTVSECVNKSWHT